MKENSKMKEIFIPAVSLFLICMVVTAILAGTNMLTAPKIAALAVQRQEEAKSAVLPEAKSFSDEQAAPAGVDAPEGTVYYEGKAEDGSFAGYVVMTTTKSYGGDAQLMIGLTADGAVSGVNILSIDDTPGLGMNAKSDPTFLEQFKGKTSTIGVAKNNPAADEIQALTGATITSKAMTKAVNTALSMYAELGGAQNG